MSANFDLGYYLKHAGNAIACTGLGYVSKVAVDVVSATLSGHKYTHAANLNDVAYTAGAFYLVKQVTDYVVDKYFAVDGKAEHALVKVITAARLTSVALLPFKVATAFQTTLLLFPVTYMGTQLADKARDYFRPATPPPAGPAAANQA